MTSPALGPTSETGLDSLRSAPCCPGPWPRPTVNKPEARDATRRRSSGLIGGRARRQAQGLGRGGGDEHWTLPCREGRRERWGGGGRRGGDLGGGSRRCARAPSAPVPGLQGAQRARPGPRPPDALPDTTLSGAWTAAHLGLCTGHCPPQGWTLQRTLLPSSGHCSIFPPGFWTLFPLPLRGPRHGAPRRL